MAVTHVDRRAVIAHCREIARTRLARVIVESCKAAEDDLFHRADRAPSREDQQGFFDAMMCVRDSASAFAFAFERAFVEQFDARLESSDSPNRTRRESEVPTLTIVDSNMLEEELVSTALARQSGYEIDSELVYALRVRLGEVLGEQQLPESRDPIAAEAVVGALRRAAAAVTQNPLARRAIASAFRPYLAQALGAIYLEVNEALVRRGVLPRIKRTVERTPATGSHRIATGAMAVTQAMHAQGWLGPTLPTGPVPLATGPVALSGGAATWVRSPNGHSAPSAQIGAEPWSESLTRALESPPPVRRAVARMLADPDRYGFREAMGTPASRALIRSLSDLQAAPVLGPRGVSAPGSFDYIATLDPAVRAASHPLDLLTVEFITTVFDHILEAPAIPETVKAQIARLQIVAVKAALLDRTFFARREHPMRRLLDRIAAAASDPETDARPGAPFLEALREIVSSVVTEFRDDLAVFDRARERLDVIVKTLSAARDDALSQTARKIERAERVELAQTTALAEIGRRVGPSTPAFVQAFLVQWWSRALTQSYVDDPTGDDSWTHRLGVVDALVWSVSGLGRTEIRQLAKMLPTLMRNLVQGMTKASVPDDARKAFFDALMRHHTAMIEGAKAGGALGMSQPIAPIAENAGKFPTEPIRPSGPTPTAEALPLPADYYEHTVRELERGTVVEFIEADRAVRTKLAWISPKHTVYLFTAGPADARQFAPQALAEALRKGQARVLDASDALLDRIVRAVAGDPGPAAG